MLSKLCIVIELSRFVSTVAILKSVSLVILGSMLLKIKENIENMITQ